MARSKKSKIATTKEAKKLWLAIRDGTDGKLPASLKEKFSAECIRTAMGIVADKKDTLTLAESAAFWQRVNAFWNDDIPKTAAYMQDGALCETDQWPFFLIEKERQARAMDGADEGARIAELEQGAGKLILQRMKANDTSFFETFTKLLQHRKEGKELRTLKHSELGLKPGKGRQRGCYSMENIVALAVHSLGMKYMALQLKIPRDELRAEINRFARANGLVEMETYEITDTDLSKWISAFQLSDYIRNKAPGPNAGSRQSVRVRS